MGAFNISINDTPGLTLYAHVFRDTLSPVAYNTGTGAFGSYSDSNADNFSISLTENANKSGYYSAAITGTGIVPQFASNYDDVNGDYRVEIWQQQGASVNKSNDIFVGDSDVIWNGTGVLRAHHRPVYNIADYFGTYNVDTAIIIFNTFYNKWNNRETLPIGQEYIQITNARTLETLTSGNLLAGIGIFGLYEGSGFTSDGYYVQYVVSGTDGETFFGYSYLTVIDNNSGIANKMLDTFGYTTGNMPGAGGNLTTTGFNTTLTETTDDFYNGQIIRFTDTSSSLYGQARIISEYNGSLKRITVNKALTDTPTNSEKFIIFPIGGELGVT